MRLCASVMSFAKCSVNVCLFCFASSFKQFESSSWVIGIRLDCEPGDWCDCGLQ